MEVWIEDHPSPAEVVPLREAIERASPSWIGAFKAAGGVSNLCTVRAVHYGGTVVEKDVGRRPRTARCSFSSSSTAAECAQLVSCINSLQ